MMKYISPIFFKKNENTDKTLTNCEKSTYILQQKNIQIILNEFSLNF